MSPSPFRVLVVDDEKSSRQTTARQLLLAGYDADAVDNAFEALERLNAVPTDVVLTDVRMPSMDGLTFLREIRVRAPDTVVLVMTAYQSVETAVGALRGGAADYLVKPFSFDELHLRLQRLKELADARKELARLRTVAESSPLDGLVGRSRPMELVRERMQLFADNTAPVLITGETGTGKEVITRTMHDLSTRCRAPFVAMPCGAIPRELAESELFGHERGAFTGATQRRVGCFERARGGTILLDDLDDLPLDLQAKLLRVLQEGSFVRVGGSEEVEVDARVIATTKIDLSRAVSEGTFREDLFYRVRGLEIAVPPLRDRGDDVLLIAQHTVDALAALSHCEPKLLAVEAAEVLRRYNWPGNVRELKRAIEYAVAMCRGPEIHVDQLPDYIRQETSEPRLFKLMLDDCSSLELQELLDRFEDELIQWALRKAGGQQSQAAQLLGIPRTTLQSKLARRSGQARSDPYTKPC